MAYWQENYSFIKDVYDTRAQKLAELMVKTDAVIDEVRSEKPYTSQEFKKVREIFAVRPHVTNWSVWKKQTTKGQTIVYQYLDDGLKEFFPWKFFLHPGLCTYTYSTTVRKFTKSTVMTRVCKG